MKGTHAADNRGRHSGSKPRNRCTWTKDGRRDQRPSEPIRDHHSARSPRIDRVRLRSYIQSPLTNNAIIKLLRSISKSSDWASLIRAEISKQVKEQVDEQITEHLPQSLQEQADESRRQLEGIKISLENSQARMANSFIGTNNLDDPLTPILTPDGKASRFYPPNTRSLFGYDLDSAQTLNKDYQLTETDDLFMNFQQFLRHIGMFLFDRCRPSPDAGYLGNRYCSRGSSVA
ncbi:hypothetical protein BDN70DRAFT_794633 [Pholiota conissans]|uniref:Uncharacterized protein n=1 Tax=Pholiota conissans TaxID=109636 RepID=A0A9P5ZF26_9AGAR|nr:hypothetical protein BDN70DRAFT_794633 [Pholiota conissans]